MKNKITIKNSKENENIRVAALVQKILEQWHFTEHKISASYNTHGKYFNPYRDPEVQLTSTLS